jgi:hypothetical protein
VLGAGAERWDSRGVHLGGMGGDICPFFLFYKTTNSYREGEASMVAGWVSSEDEIRRMWSRKRWSSSCQDCDRVHWDLNVPSMGGSVLHIETDLPNAACCGPFAIF